MSINEKEYAINDLEEFIAENPDRFLSTHKFIELFNIVKNNGQLYDSFRGPEIFFSSRSNLAIYLKRFPESHYYNGIDHSRAASIDILVNKYRLNLNDCDEHAINSFYKKEEVNFKLIADNINSEYREFLKNIIGSVDWKKSRIVYGNISKMEINQDTIKVHFDEELEPVEVIKTPTLEKQALMYELMETPYNRLLDKANVNQLYDFRPYANVAVELDKVSSVIFTDVLNITIEGIERVFDFGNEKANEKVYELIVNKPKKPIVYNL